MGPGTESVDKYRRAWEFALNTSDKECETSLAQRIALEHCSYLEDLVISCPELGSKGEERAPSEVGMGVGFRY